MGKTTAHSGDDLTECFPHHPLYKKVPHKPYCTGNVHHDYTASWLREERGPIGPAGPTRAQGPVGASATGTPGLPPARKAPRTGRRRNVLTSGGIPGEQGPQDPAGPQGPPGSAEAPGSPGVLGTPGEPSHTGTTWRHDHAYHAKCHNGR